MINSISYYILLVIIIIFYCLTLTNNIKKSPKRIKIIYNILIAIAFIKNLAIIILGIISNPSYIKLFELICFSNLFYVPAIFLVLFYSFWRNNQFNFNIIISSLVVIAILAIFILTILKAKFIVLLDYGYIIQISKNIFEMIFVITILIILAICLFSKKCIRTNFTGILGITIVSIAFIVEYLVIFCNINIYPYGIISEILLIALMNYSFIELDIIKN